MSLTYKTVQQALRKVGIVISKKGEVHRINFFSALEKTAYYTTNLQDALDRGMAMAGKAEKPRSGDFPKSGEKGRRVSTGARIG